MERWLVVLVALHSLAVGVALAGFPGFAVRLAGWKEASPAFFPRQAGVFHLVLALGYLLEHLRFRSVTLLLCAKAAAAAFLLSATATGGVPWAVPVSGVLDALMGAAVWCVHRRAPGRCGEAAGPGAAGEG